MLQNGNCWSCNAEAASAKPDFISATPSNKNHTYVRFLYKRTCTCAWVCMCVWVCMPMCGLFFFALACWLLSLLLLLWVSFYTAAERRLCYCLCLCRCRCRCLCLCHWQATLALRFSSPLQSLLTFSAFAFVRCFLRVSVRSPYFSLCLSLSLPLLLVRSFSLSYIYTGTCFFFQRITFNFILLRSCRRYTHTRSHTHVRTAPHLQLWTCSFVILRCVN